MVPKEWMDLGKMDTELANLLANRPSVAAPTTIPTLRELAYERKKAFTAIMSPPNPTAGVLESDTTVTARDGFRIPIRIYRPESAPSEGCPLIVFMHSGGFCIGGGPENEELNCRRFCQDFTAVVVNPDYRLAPEYPFSAAPNDCWDVLKWTAANGFSLGADTARDFIIGGTSAGANLSVVLALLAVEEKLSPPLSGLALLVPGLGDIPAEFEEEIQSKEQNKEAPPLSREVVSIFRNSYKPDPTSPLYSAFVRSEDFGHLPPVFLQVCGMDPLRDEALIFEHLLRTKHGIKTKLKVYPGQPHNFWAAFPELSASRKFVADTVEGVGWLLKLRK